MLQDQDEVNTVGVSNTYDYLHLRIFQEGVREAGPDCAQQVVRGKSLVP